MYIVEKQWNLGDYAVLFINPEITEVKYNAVEIDGEKYKLVPCMDIRDTIAIESEGRFEGKKVEFIKI